ncbi:thermonuclease family protein [Leisingera sp. ANG-Vp]|uniref:thermonuclease family protein n=1 Tax=Leisingera sp. ANG-Vp TaxID=1577896 RepID=UPI00068E9551|nr:thermonuclease family protein [Leisingera sp. ANG-Vp]
MRLLLAALFLFLAVPVQAAPVSSRDIYLIDGDTADVGGDRFRLVGYDTPETYKPQCSYEQALGEEATRRARQLVRDAGTVDFIILPGRGKYGRGLARIILHGNDLGGKAPAKTAVPFAL